MKGLKSGLVTIFVVLFVANSSFAELSRDEDFRYFVLPRVESWVGLKPRFEDLSPDFVLEKLIQEVSAFEDYKHQIFKYISSQKLDAIQLQRWNILKKEIIKVGKQLNAPIPNLENTTLKIALILDKDILFDASNNRCSKMPYPSYKKYCYMSYEDAVEFCKEQGSRLPTLREWAQIHGFKILELNEYKFLRASGELQGIPGTSNSVEKGKNAGNYSLYQAFDGNVTDRFFIRSQENAIFNSPSVSYWSSSAERTTTSFQPYSFNGTPEKIGWIGWASGGTNQVRCLAK